MKVAAFSNTLCHVKISFGTLSASAAGQLGKESLMVCPAPSVSAVPHQQLHHRSRPGYCFLQLSSGLSNVCDGFVLNGLCGGAQI